MLMITSIALVLETFLKSKK